MGRRTKAVELLAVFALLLTTGVAQAAERAEMLYSRGLVEFHASRYSEAVNWFDQAVAAEPANAPARYYRAMARARLDDRAGAIADLQGALDLQPSFSRARLELAGLLIDEQRYDEASVHLGQISAVPELEGQVAFFKGIIALRRDDLETARTNFRYAAARDPNLAASSSYYQGVIAQRQNESQLARQQFTASLNQRPGSAVSREALNALQGQRSGSNQRVMLYAEAGFQYDSNVCLLPTDDSAGCAALDSSDVGNGDIGTEGDGRAVFTVGGLVRPIVTERFQLTAGYEFFQSLHFDLVEFNLQDHRPRVQMTGDLGPVVLGLLGQYDYYLLQENSFLQEITALPWVTVLEGGFGRAELYYRMRRRDFKMLLFDVRDAYNHAAGARQVFYLGNPWSYAFLGYRFDDEDPDEGLGAFGSTIDAQEFAYFGHEGSIGIRWLWPFEIPTEASFVYRNEKYDSASKAPDGKRRRDNEYRVRAYIEIPWSSFAPNFIASPYLSFGLAYMFNLNNSNKEISDRELYDYDRHIASFTVQARY